MTRSQRHPTAAMIALLGVLGWAAAASAVTPGQTTGQAASSTGSQPAEQPVVTETGKASGCTTTGGAVPESGGWKQEETKKNLQPAQGAGPCTEAGQTSPAKGQ